MFALIGGLSLSMRRRSAEEQMHMYAKTKHKNDLRLYVWPFHSLETRSAIARCWVPLTWNMGKSALHDIR